MEIAVSIGIVADIIGIISLVKLKSHLNKPIFSKIELSEEMEDSLDDNLYKGNFIVCK